MCALADGHLLLCRNPFHAHTTCSTDVCYCNSALQALYMQPELRAAILKLEFTGSIMRTSLMYQVQQASHGFGRPCLVRPLQRYPLFAHYSAIPCSPTTALSTHAGNRMSPRC